MSEDNQQSQRVASSHHDHSFCKAVMSDISSYTGGRATEKGKGVISSHHVHSLQKFICLTPPANWSGGGWPWATETLWPILAAWNLQLCLREGSWEQKGVASPHFNWRDLLEGGQRECQPQYQKVQREWPWYQGVFAFHFNMHLNKRILKTGWWRVI